MRLIDADAFEKFIKEKYKDGESTDDIKDQFLFDLSYQPTSYDPEAVVAELEEEREYSYADFEEYVNEKSPCLDAEYDDYFHRGLERAIKLVRKGGA